MSKKNRLENKRARKMQRALQVSPPPFIDLVNWLVDRKHADTRSKAAEIIKERRVKSESHVLGFKQIEGEIMNEESGEMEATSHEVYDRFVPGKLRDTIEVLSPAAVESPVS